MNRTELIFRIIGMIVLAILGVYWGIELGEIFGVSQILASAVLGVIGALVGFIVTPYVTTRPASYLVQALGKTSFQSLIAGLVGLVVGLLGQPFPSLCCPIHLVKSCLSSVFSCSATWAL
jgi:uncharacterized protein YacL